MELGECIHFGLGKNTKICVRFTSDSKRFATIGSDGLIKVGSLEASTIVKTIDTSLLRKQLYC